MSVGPLGMIGSAAGSPLSQTKGSDAEKAQHDAASQTRQSASANKAEMAAGIGQTEHDEQASDRDADGRRVWEIGPQQEQEEGGDGQSEGGASKSKDPTGQSGNQLDLSG